MPRQPTHPPAGQEVGWEPQVTVRFLQSLFRHHGPAGVYLLETGGRTYALSCRDPLPFAAIAEAARSGKPVRFSPALRLPRDHDTIVAVPVVAVRLRTAHAAAEVLAQLQDRSPAAVVASGGAVEVYWHASASAPDAAQAEAERLSAACGGEPVPPGARCPLPLRAAEVALADADTTPQDAIPSPPPEAPGHQAPAAEGGADGPPHPAPAGSLPPLLASLVAATGPERVERITVVPGRPVEVLLQGGELLTLVLPPAEEVLAAMGASRPPRSGECDGGVRWRLAHLGGRDGIGRGAVIRFARARAGAAEPLRALLLAGASLAVAGRRAERRAEVLADAARTLASSPHRTVAVIDVGGELGGAACEVGRALLLTGGSPTSGARLLARCDLELEPDAVVLVRLTTRREAAALRDLASAGVQVLVGVPCASAAACLSWPPGSPLWGLVVDERTGRPRRVLPPAVGTIATVDAHGALRVDEDAVRAADPSTLMRDG